jgi:hypothetical protein
MSDQDEVTGAPQQARHLRVLPREDTGFHVFTRTRVQRNVSLTKPNSTAVTVWLFERDGLFLRLFQKINRLAASFSEPKREGGFEQFLMGKGRRA